MSDNPYTTPSAEIESESHQIVKYVGFWARFVATIVDSIILSLIIYPTLYLIYGMVVFDPNAGFLGVGQLFVNYLLPLLFVVLFWKYRSATPGKMAMRAKIVDAETLGKPSTGQLIGRYLGYIVSTIPLLLGYVWAAFDKRKQTLHDKLAGTVVIYR